MLSQDIHQIQWDIKKDFTEEGIPDEVLKAIKFSKLAEAMKYEHLPRFMGFTRDLTVVILTTESQDMNLRWIIGHRK